jgi:pyruvate/2-oxoglutarate dehydrogenase complex dihydrolipoamide acyltransferase (E2) component
LIRQAKEVATGAEPFAPKVSTRSVEVGGVVETSQPGEGRRRLKVSPLARRLAEEKGVSLEGITGTGPGGSIMKEDVLKAFELKKTLPGYSPCGIRSR